MSDWSPSSGAGGLDENRMELQKRPHGEDG